MVLELVKEINDNGDKSYHIRADGVYVPRSSRFDVIEANMLYEELKASYNKGRTEVLIREEI